MRWWMTPPSKAPRSSIFLPRALTTVTTNCAARSAVSHCTMRWGCRRATARPRPGRRWRTSGCSARRMWPSSPVTRRWACTARSIAVPMSPTSCWPRAPSVWPASPRRRSPRAHASCASTSAFPTTAKWSAAFRSATKTRRIRRTAFAPAAPTGSRKGGFCHEDAARALLSKRRWHPVAGCATARAPRRRGPGACSRLWRLVRRSAARARQLPGQAAAAPRARQRVQRRGRCAGLQRGARVCGTRMGAWSEYVCLPRPLAYALLPQADFTEGSVLMASFFTALYALRERGALREGETLLVLGASGGVGHAAVQLGKVLGPRVIAAASTEAKREAARAAGADDTVDSSSADWKDHVKALAPKGVDVVYDPVGGDATDAGFRTLGWNGRLLMIGFAGGQIGQLKTNLSIAKGAALVGVDAR